MSNAIEVMSSAEAVAERVADLVIAAARSAHSNVILAGGTTPAAAYQRLGSRLQADAATGLHLWYGDERMVAPDHADSNARMVRTCWLDAAGWPAEREHRICGELGATEAAAAISAELRIHVGADPRFDLALLGVGADGHTASLFPGEPVAEGWFAPARQGSRVTATYSLLWSAREVVFVVTGSGKAEVLQRVWAGAAPQLPVTRVAQGVRERGGQVRWIADVSAAGARK